LENKTKIDKWYVDLTTILDRIAKSLIPSMSVNTLKFWWSHELSLLKSNAIDSHSRWVEAHKPRSGAVFELMKDCKYKYILFIKKAKA